jgi:ABC-type maltose transport system permease subunit
MTLFVDEVLRNALKLNIKILGIGSALQQQVKPEFGTSKELMMPYLARYFGHTQLSVADQFEVLLFVANTVLAVALAVLLATVLICYPLSYLFSFELQLAGHLSMIFSATLVKIAYVCRCIALYELHREVR